MTISTDSRTTPPRPSLWDRSPTCPDRFPTCPTRGWSGRSIDEVMTSRRGAAPVGRGRLRRRPVGAADAEHVRVGAQVVLVDHVARRTKAERDLDGDRRADRRQVVGAELGAVPGVVPFAAVPVAEVDALDLV